MIDIQKFVDSLGPLSISKDDAAVACEALRCEAIVETLNEAAKEREQLLLRIQHFVGRCEYGDSYGVEGSSFSACMLCRGGGAPGVPLIHEENCPVAAVADTYQAYCDEQREFEKEHKQLRTALEKIASYGERHLGYVNCRIDDMSLSKFARTSLGQQHK